MFKVCLPSYWMGSKNMEFDRKAAIRRIMMIIIVIISSLEIP